MRKWTFLFIFLAIVLGVLCFFTFGHYSEGKRGGYVNKLSKKGYIFKTYEGELRIGGLFEGDGSMNTSEWEFSVNGSNKDVIAKLEDAIKNGSRVSLTYEEKYFSLGWIGDTKYFVTEVEVLDNRGPSFPDRTPSTEKLPAPTEIDTTKVL